MPVWEHDLQARLRLLRLGVETHLVTSHHALRLLIGEPGGLVVEMTDGTAESNAVNHELAQEHEFDDLDGSRPDCWRCMVEVQDPGLPADTTGYR